MKITSVLPTLSLTGGVRVLSIYTELLQKRGQKIFIVSRPPRQATLIQQLRSLLRGRSWRSARKKEQSHFDKVDVESRVLETYRAITDKDIPDAAIIMATGWETTEWVAKLSPSKRTKVYFLQHYEAFDCVPKGRVESTWQLPMHKIAGSLWPADIAWNQYGDLSVSLVPPTADTKQFYDPLSIAPPPRGKQLVPKVGMYYTTTPWKGCDIALKAFSIAAEKIPNFRLVAFGSGNTPHPNLLPDGTEYNKALPSKPSKRILQQMRCLAVFQQSRRLRLANYRHSCWCGSGTTWWRGWHTCQAKRPRGYGTSDRAGLSVFGCRMTGNVQDCFGEGDKL